MSSLFIYEAARVDARLLGWARERGLEYRTIEQADQTGPGFSGSDLAKTGAPNSHFGPVTRQLWDLTYWLFVGLGDPVILHPDAGSETKSVLVANVGHHAAGLSHAGVAYLTVWAKVADHGAGEPVLVPFPHVAEVLVSPNSGANFRQSREALHDAAVSCVDRVNLVWPAALALAMKGK